MSHLPPPGRNLNSDPVGLLPTWVADPAVTLPDLAQVMPLTKFERAVVVGRRALQLSQGAVAQVAASVPNDDPVLVALAELECNRVTPMRVFRYKPDGTHVVVSVREAAAHADRYRPW
jgi:DNA-directed RNA polymerase subunit K/omega